MAGVRVKHDCMDAGGRATHGAVAEEARTELSEDGTPRKIKAGHGKVTDTVIRNHPSRGQIYSQKIVSMVIVQYENRVKTFNAIF